MANETSDTVRIKTDVNGRFESISLRRSALVDVVASSGRSWSQPILLYGSDITADVELLLRDNKARDDWNIFENIKQLLAQRGIRYGFKEIEERLNISYYDNLPYMSKTRLKRILLGQEPLDQIIGFVTKGPSGSAVFNDKLEANNFIDEIQRLCSTTGLIMPWHMEDSLLPAFILAIWKKRDRLRPLIIWNDKRIKIPDTEVIEVPATDISFDSLALEIERALKLSKLDAEKAYRVWQLSRNPENKKPEATTPRNISLRNASLFLDVLARSRNKSDLSGLGIQKSAPLIFEIDESRIDLSRKPVKSDALELIRASASSLLRRLEHIRHDMQIENMVPTSRDIVPVVIRILDKIVQNSYNEGDIVEMGLELNAFQWHIDAVKQHFSEVSIGELTGLFATSTLFLSRFPIWLEYTGLKTPHGIGDDGVAEFRLARDFLSSARQPMPFLTSDASERIGAILDRVPENTDAPALREGLVRSGENLAAVTAAGLSHVVTTEARQLGNKVKDEVYQEASSSILNFAAKNAPVLLRLAELRDWPWLDWLRDQFTK